MDKSTLRKNLLIRRKELDTPDVAKRSKILTEMIIEKVDLSKIEKIHCFLPIIGSNEPDMRQFINHLTTHGIEVFTTMPDVPVSTADSATSNYSLGDKIQFDQIIVPMLAYDPVTKHRLGFGGGFYDRLLASQKAAQSIGVCFKEFEIRNLPVESHDQPLQKIFAV